MTGQCEGCSAPFGMFASKKTCAKEEGGCGKTLCNKCLNFACMTADEVLPHAPAIRPPDPRQPLVVARECHTLHTHLVQPGSVQDLQRVHIPHDHVGLEAQVRHLPRVG